MVKVRGVRGGDCVVFNSPLEAKWTLVFCNADVFVVEHVTCKPMHACNTLKLLLIVSLLFVAEVAGVRGGGCVVVFLSSLEAKWTFVCVW